MDHDNVALYELLRSLHHSAASSAISSHVNKVPIPSKGPRAGAPFAGDDVIDDLFPDSLLQSHGLLLSFDLATQLVQLLFEESRSLSVSIQDLQGVISSLTSRHVAVDSVFHVLHSLIVDSQKRPSDSSKHGS